MYLRVCGLGGVRSWLVPASNTSLVVTGKCLSKSFKFSRRSYLVKACVEGVITLRAYPC